MKSIVTLRGVQIISRRQLRERFQERLSNRCHALYQANAQLKAKLAKEKDNSVSLKKLTVQLCQESAEARDRVAVNKLLQEKLERTDNEISQSQENFKADLQLEREKNRHLQEKLKKKCESNQDLRKRYESESLSAINQAHKLQRELENCLEQKKSLQNDYETLRVADTYIVQGVSAQLDAQTEKTRLLQQELQRKCLSIEEINQRHAFEAYEARVQVHNLQHETENGVKQHNGLQKDYEELRVAHDNFKAELHAERQKNMVLKAELEKTCGSYNEISQRYAIDASNARHELDNLLRKLQYVVQQHEVLQKDYEKLSFAHLVNEKTFTAELHAERQKNTVLQELKGTRVSDHKTKIRSQRDEATGSEACRVMNNLRAEQDAVHQKTAERTSCLSPDKKAGRSTNDISLDTDVEMECV